MAKVHIPAAMRALTGGAAEVEVAGQTLGEAIANLEAAYPGLQSRLIEGDRLRPGLAAFVNGIQIPRRLHTRIAADAEIYFAPALSGG
jgi:molybdopterin converting factor small subunit